MLTGLYKTLIRPLLEYCVPAWSPYYRKDKELLERVQHRFTRMVPGLSEMSYPQRLRRLGLWSLEERRNRADLIELFKIYKGFSKVNFQDMFETAVESRTRGHSAKLIIKRNRLDLRKFFFSERVKCRWNRLSQDEVDSATINHFKAILTKKRENRMGFFMDTLE